MIHRIGPRRWRQPQRTAFTLTELLIALALIGVVILISARLFTAVMRTYKATADVQNSLAQFDAMSLALRSDVWRGREIAVPNDRTVSVHLDDGGVAKWHLNDDATITRTLGDPKSTATTQNAASARQWLAADWSVRFSSRPVGLRMRVTAKNAEPLDIDFQSVMLRPLSPTPRGVP